MRGSRRKIKREEGWKRNSKREKERKKEKERGGRKGGKRGVERERWDRERENIYFWGKI